MNRKKTNELSRGFQILERQAENAGTTLFKKKNNNDFKKSNSQNQRIELWFPMAKGVDKWEMLVKACKLSVMSKFYGSNVQHGDCS